MRESNIADEPEVEAFVAASNSEAERNYKLTRLSIVIGFAGAVVGVGGTLLAATMSNAATSSEMRQQFQQEQRAVAYSDLISASDANVSTFSRIISGSYWSLQGKDDSTQGEKSQDYEAWYASETAFSHATTKVTMVGSAQESKLALLMWRTYMSGRSAYQNADSPDEVSASGREYEHELSKLRTRFIAIATDELGGGK